MIRFVATIGDDQVIRPPTGLSIPGGEVEVVLWPTAASPALADVGDNDSMAATRAWLLEIAVQAELTAPPLPSDMALNHDHYAHGKPLP